VRIFLFCRYPKLGKVKSRLAAHCGKEKALLLYKKMLSTILENIDDCGRPLVVHYTGCSSSEAAHWFANRQVKAQSAGDLGEKLVCAVREGFGENQDSIVLIGADCPDINATLLEEVERELKFNDLVIGPAVDGGYYLLALKECIEPLFRGITWGTKKVLKQTLEIAAIENLKVKLLEEKNDMDYWEDIPAEWRQEVDC
jgi:uncharacterized protein